LNAQAARLESQVRGDEDDQVPLDVLIDVRAEKAADDWDVSHISRIA
jgi:hypothetical protein